MSPRSLSCSCGAAASQPYPLDPALAALFEAAHRGDGHLVTGSDDPPRRVPPDPADRS